MDNSAPIGVLDSGLGGLSVLRQLRQLMPGENYLYFGDSANAPYGTRPPEEVIGLATAAVEKLTAKGIKALVLGCNTATAVAFEALRQRWPELILVGIEPAVAPAAAENPGGHIGVLATPVTLAGPKFLGAKTQAEKLCRVSPIPGPGLVELVEAGMTDTPEAEALLHRLLDPYRGQLDGLVLGCTHYPFLEKAIRRVIGDVKLYDGAALTARQAMAALTQRQLLHRGPGSLVLENSLGTPEILELTRRLAGD